MHDFALLLSRTDRWKETLDTACRASRLAPGLSTLDAISKRLYVQLRALPQEEKQAALRQIARLPLLNLSLANFGIADLTILEGTEARALDVSHNPVANLDPLKGLQLRSLMLGPAPITDLSPLRGMPLKLLTLKGLPVKDLTPLRGLPLESLRLLNCPAIDFGTLTGVKPRLLHIEGCSIQDPSVLEHTGASIVRIGSTPLSDLRFMKGLPLQGLWLANNGLSDLEPLRGAKVVKCVIRDNRVEDLGPLSDCPRLDNLILTGNPVRDLSPLRKLTLRALVIADTNVTDLTALGELPLKSLDLSHTGVTDLSPLAGRPLESLFMRGTTVRKLDPLSSLPGLKHLDVSERALDDEALRVLAGLSLVKLEIDLDAKTLAVLSRMKTLQQVGPFTARYIRRVAPAIAKALAAERIDSAQVHRLRALATPQHGVERLLVPMPMSYAQAAAFCQTLGASLACPSTRQEADDLAECLGSGGHRWDLQVWIGLENRNGVLLIPSGANVEWLARQLPPVAKEALLHGARLLISRASIEEGLSSYSWTYPDSADGNKSTKLPFVVEWRTPR